MPATTTQTRAPAGGSYGANGEWYEGGKFINTVAKNGKRTGAASKASRKQEIEPYTWAFPPEPGKMSLYARSRVFMTFLSGQAAPADLKQVTLDYYGLTLEQLQAWADQYNAGQRWI